jgi:hypothetical protein
MKKAALISYSPGSRDTRESDLSLSTPWLLYAVIAIQVASRLLNSIWKT